MLRRLREPNGVVCVPRVVHFEVSAEKPERAAKFYEDVFGWKIVKWEGPVDYWLIMTGKQDELGIDGGLGTRESLGEAGTVNTIDVPSVEEYSRKVEENGGKIVVAEHAIPGVGWIAYFKDPEGNMFGIMQDDSSAK